MKPLELNKNDVSLMVWTIEALMERWPDYKFALVVNTRDGENGGVIASSQHPPEQLMETMRNASGSFAAQDKHVAYMQPDGSIKSAST